MMKHRQTFWRVMIVLVSFLCLWVATASISTSSISPPNKTNLHEQRQRPNHRFTWTTHFDNQKGIASSDERSSFKHTGTAAAVGNKAQDLFQNYPKWLCRGSVTFGLFQTNAQEKGSTTIQCRVLPSLKLLTFGPPRITSTFQRWWQGFMSSTTISAGCDIPIVGGLLAYQEQGHLYFGLLKENTYNNNTPYYTIQTNIVNYQPAITGKAPVSKLRSVIYQNTQCIVHAYVMWRFHHYCQQELLTSSSFE